MPSVFSDRSPYFPLSVAFSARARHRYELPLEPSHPSVAESLFHLRLAGSKLSADAASGTQLNLLAQLNRALRELGRQFLIARQKQENGLFATDMQRELRTLLELFPPHSLLRGGTPEEYLSVDREGYRQALLELFLLALHNDNPAVTALRPLFDDQELQQRCDYRQGLARFDDQLIDKPVQGRLGTSLRELLWAPIKRAPGSLVAQLQYVRQQWAELLPPDLLLHIDSAFDVLASEEQPRGWGPPQVAVPQYPAVASPQPDTEQFSPDTDWMPRTVLMAKSTYVWLNQLSRIYERPIQRLADIPDRELDLLAERGFTALWLIGLWERSPASQQIKRIMGNPEAEASAYSLYDYSVAEDLGGQQDLAQLNDRCRQRGLRLACDVVPNHTGIVSRWIEEHPDWFIQLDYPPYPGYRFDGPDLSSREDSIIQIENGYFDHSDAAVVFKHSDRNTGRVRYIYHGNDGTHTPWNDTAQLNFLLPEVREAMIQNILQVARTFKVIRFDAAMTLAKKHFQRLWFPCPGGGAGVPSRAEHWMEGEQFERAFPVEFWREVVDRVAAEAPDTLLLAEAFWLMESFFVRTLGMHRVYNSAFMHMLKNEDNDKYQQLLKNTLEFNPEILKRFVNFMSNPDEASAVEQFGKGDKYFGVAVLLVTLPGLPMFGHGQVEGLAEKYGMEYRRSYWDEKVDQGFVNHHQSQIFPLLHRRALFSGARHFELYPLETDQGINQDVFAYSNGDDRERVLVAYHNRPDQTSGWIRQSVAKARQPDAEGQNPSTTTLTAALGIHDSGVRYCRFRDLHSAEQYLRSADELNERGLFLHLGSYQYRVFVDFVWLQDEDGTWGQLCHQLDGKPVADLDLERRRLRCAPLLGRFEQLLQHPLLSKLSQRLAGAETRGRGESANAEPLLKVLAGFVRQLQPLAEPPQAGSAWGSALRAELKTLLKLSKPPTPKSEGKGIHSELRRLLSGSLSRILPFFLLFHRLDEVLPDNGAWLEDPLLQESLARHLGAAEQRLLPVLIRWQDLLPKQRPLIRLLDDPAVQSYLQVHDYQGQQWLNAEALVELAEGLWFVAALKVAGQSSGRALNLSLEDYQSRIQKLLVAGEKAGYRFDCLREDVDLNTIAGIKDKIVSK